MVRTFVAEVLAIPDSIHVGVFHAALAAIRSRTGLNLKFQAVSCRLLSTKALQSKLLKTGSRSSKSEFISRWLR